MDQVSALYNLQEIDSEILACTHRRSHSAHEAEVKAFEERLSKMAAQIKLCLSQKEELIAQIDQSDSEVLSCKNRIEEINQVCQSSSDHRFLLEARDEISLLEKRIDKLEFQATPLREKLAQYTKVIEGSAHKMKAEHARYLELQQVVAQEAADLTETIEALMVERAEEAGRLDAQTLDRYESSRLKHNGIGLARLTEDGSCSACKMTFPEGIVLRLRRGTIFTECPNCHRFMVVEEALDD